MPLNVPVLRMTRGLSSDGPLPSGADEVLALLPRYEHLHNDNTMPNMDPSPARVAESYRVCQQITSVHSRSFFFSSQLLPPAKRRAVRALYAFCRISDDTVDVPLDDDPARALARWVWLVSSPTRSSYHPILPAWHATCHDFALPTHLANELLAGVAMDLSITRYATFDDLWLYCYRVASVVGLLSMHIVGFDQGAEPYAITLGVALQLTNILRDVGEDARRGRIYLPQEDLQRFGLCDADILAGVRDERFRALMDFEIVRAHHLYDESWPGIALLATDSQLAIGAASQVYRSILDKIVENEYDVYTRRAHLSSREKLRLLPGLWWRVRQLARQ